MNIIGINIEDIKDTKRLITRVGWKKFFFTMTTSKTWEYIRLKVGSWENVCPANLMKASEAFA